MNSAGEWCLIESDPGVFTALIKGFGVDGLQVEEIITLEKECFQKLEPIHGLIFLFKCIDDKMTEGTMVQDNRLENIFFAEQVISNACATQAIISVLLNLKDKNVKLGSTLQDFKDFTKSFSPNLKGVSLSNSKLIKEVHNSFSRQQVFEYDQSGPKSDENYHFIAYMPIDGRLYELDGLKSGPIDHGKVTPEDWIDSVRNVIDKRIARYAANEINFNLMAVIGDQKQVINNKIESLNKEIEALQNENGQDKFLRIEMVRSEIAYQQSRLATEDEKRRGYEVENIRRKHNYLPFIIEMLRVLADNEKLIPLVNAAKQKRDKKKNSKREVGGETSGKKPESVS